MQPPRRPEVRQYLSPPEEPLQSIDPFRYPEPSGPIFLKEGQTFSEKEDLFRSVSENVFVKNGYVSQLQPHELAQIYLEYRDTADFNLLIAELDKERQKFEAIVAEQTRDLQEQSKYGMPLEAPEPGSFEMMFEYQKIMKNITAHCHVEVLEHLISVRAGRKGVALTEDCHLAATEAQEVAA
jgi:hypothetical protein